MFKVIDKTSDDIHTVYAVKEIASDSMVLDAGILFLIFQKGHWIWINAQYYNPYPALKEHIR